MENPSVGQYSLELGKILIVVYCDSIAPEECLGLASLFFIGGELVFLPSIIFSSLAMSRLSSPSLTD